MRDAVLDAHRELWQTGLADAGALSVAMERLRGEFARRLQGLTVEGKDEGDVVGEDNDLPIAALFRQALRNAVPP